MRTSPICLCELSTVGPGQSRGFAGPDYTVFLLRTPGGALRAYHNRCPHQGLELEWRPDQFLDGHGEYVICANHGAVFDPDNGLCVHGPCRGQGLQPARIEIRDGYVWLVPD